jgi:hypothetical protein
LGIRPAESSCHWASSAPGSAPPLSARRRPITTRQASLQLQATGRRVTPPNGAFDAGLRPGPVSRPSCQPATEPPGSYRAGLTPAGDDELCWSQLLNGPSNSGRVMDQG